MTATGKLIPAQRMRWIPKELRLAHEYCFFLHDECVRMLVEYEKARAHIISFKFKNKSEERRFRRAAEKYDAIFALRLIGREDESRRVTLNTITMAMVSDCCHHIYESLRCFEKRKFVPAFNLLRKPLLDSLMYLIWMVADEDNFYAEFTSGDPSRITQKMIGNRRKNLIAAAIEMAELNDIIDADDIVSMIFDSRNEFGLYGLFQHAVHLVTVDRLEIKTSPENFNFIFKNPSEDDIYDSLYSQLPIILLLLTHVIAILFGRIQSMDAGTFRALKFRSINGGRLIQGSPLSDIVVDVMSRTLSPLLKCATCDTSIKVTHHNAARLILTDTFRCTTCKRVSPFPFSWTFGD
ncbi:hypothetical protein QZN00_19290 [Burkholderia multivorans]|nr:hypothetical protein [Burkholderia multivorans]